MVKRLLTGLAIAISTLIPFSTSALANTESNVEVEGCAIDDLDKFKAVLESQEIVLPNLNAQTLGLVQAGDTVRLTYDWSLNSEALAAAGYDMNNLANCGRSFAVYIYATHRISEGPLRVVNERVGTGTYLENLEIFQKPITWTLVLNLPGGFSGMESIDQTVTVDLLVRVTQVTPTYQDTPRNLN